MAYELAKAYVQIVPTTKGIKGGIEGALSGEASSAGKKAGGLFTSGFSGALKGVGIAAGGALVAGTAAVTGLVGSAVKTGAEFDKSMSQVAATMGKSMEDMLSETNTVDMAWGTFSGNLRDYAQEVGANTAFSAQQVAEALNYMALAGYDTQTSMEMLPNVLNLAAAGNMDLASASDMVTDTQSALGLSLEETQTMVDQMAQTSSKSNTSVEQLGEAMLKIGATARNVKGGTQELSTILGVLADNGIKGTEGGTHLRNMLLSLQQAAEDGSVDFGDFSVSVYDADGNMRSMIDIIEDMQDGMGDMSQEAQDAMLSGIFNKTDLASINALLGTGSDRFDELTGAIGNASGAAQQMADTQLDNLAGDITLMKSAFEGLQIAISDGTAPALRDIVSGITDVLNGFNDMVSGVEGGTEKVQTGVEKVLGGIMDGIPMLADIAGAVLGGIVDMIPDIIKVIGKVLAKIPEIVVNLGKAIFEAIPDILGAVVDLVKNIGRALLGLDDPIETANEKFSSMTGVADATWESINETMNTPVSVDGLLSNLGNTTKDIDTKVDEIEGKITEIIQARLSEQKGLRDKDIADIENYMEEIRRLEDEKLSIYGSQSDATIESMKRSTDASGAELLAQYNEVVKYNDLAREAANNSKTNEYIEAKNIYTAETASLKTKFEEQHSITQEQYDAGLKEAETHYSNLLSAADSHYTEEIAALDANEAEALAIATGSDQEWLQRLNSRMDESKAIMDEGLSSINEADIKTDFILGIASDKAAEAASSMMDSFSQADIAAAQSMFSMAASIKSGGGEISTEMASTIDSLLDSFEGLPEDLQDQGGEFLASLCVGMEEQLPAVGDLSGKTADEIIETLRTQLDSGFGGSGGSFGEIGSNATKGISEGMVDGIDSINPSAKKVTDTVQEALKSGLQEHSPSRVTQTIGEYATEGLSRGILAKVSLPAQSAARVVTQAITAMRNGQFSTSVYLVGVSLMNGVAEGMRSRSWAVEQAAADAVRAAVNRAKTEGKIHSPSQVMRDEIGLMLSEGIGVGILSGEDYILRSINTVSDSITDASKDMSLSAGMNLNDMAAFGSSLGTASRYNRYTDEPGSGSTPIYITNNIDGAENPEDFANRLCRQIKIEMRMA